MLRLAATPILFLLLGYSASYAVPREHEPSNASTKSHAEKGLLAFRQGNLPEALNELTFSIEISPDYRAYLLRATIWLELEQYSNVISDCSDSIALLQFISTEQKGRSTAGSIENESPQIAKDLFRAIKLSATAYLCRGQAKVRTGDYLEAIKDFNKVLELDHQTTKELSRSLELSATTYLVCGQANVEAGKHLEAIRDFTNALELDHQSTSALMSRAWAWNKLHYPYLALMDLDRAAGSDPQEGSMEFERDKIWLTLARSTLATLETDENEERIAPDKDSVQFYLLRGGCSFHDKDYSNAKRDFTRALAIDGNSVHALIQLSYLLSSCPDTELRNLTLAQKIVTNACESSNWEDFEKILWLASIHSKKGDNEQALTELQKAAEVAPEVYKPVVEELIRSQFYSHTAQSNGTVK